MLELHAEQTTGELLQHDSGYFNIVFLAHPIPSTAWNRRWRPSAGSHSFFSGARSVGHGYVRRLQPLGSLCHLKLHFCAFFETTVAVRLNGREVHEHVLTVLPLD